MTKKQEIENALKEAMKAGDDLRKRTLRMALSAIRMAEIDKREAIDDNAVMALLQKEVKSRQESIEDAQRADRSDLIAASKDEIEVLEAFLPKQLTPEELQKLAQQAIAEVGATSQKEMGQVMKALMPLLQGRATGNQASQVVRELLS